MTPPPPGIEKAVAGSHALDGSVREREWRSCLRRLSALHESDRHAAARALHNQIGQAVSAIKMSAHLTLDEADAAQRREDLLEIIRIADDTVAQLRELHALLHPPQLDSLGLEAALRGEAERLSAASPARIELDIATLPQRPAAEIELAAFRIARQVLRQAAQQDRILLRLRDEGDSLLLRLECGDGVALEDDTLLLREWAAAVNGDLSIGAAPDAGIRFELRLPYALPDTAVSAHTPSP